MQPRPRRCPSTRWWPWVSLPGAWWTTDSSWSTLRWFRHSHIVFTNLFSSLNYIHQGVSWDQSNAGLEHTTISQLKRNKRCYIISFDCSSCRAAFLLSISSRTSTKTPAAWTTTTRPSCWWTMGVWDAEERRGLGPSWRTTSPTSAQASGVRNGRSKCDVLSMQWRNRGTVCHCLAKT